MLKRRFLQTSILLLLLITFLSINTLTANADQPNLLTANQADGGEDGTTTGFSAWNGVIANNNTVAHTGTHSIYVTTPGTQMEGVYVVVPNFGTIIGHTYYAGAWVKAPAGAGMMTQLSTGSPTYQSNDKSFIGTGDWQWVYDSITSNGNTTSSAYFGVYCAYPYSSLTYNVDDFIFFEEIGEAPIIGINTTSATFNEGDTANITIMLNTLHGNTTYVNYNTTDSTAVYGTDYNLTSSQPYGNFVLDGDSITEGLYTSHNQLKGLAGYLQDKDKHWNYINLGVSGRTVLDGVNNESTAMSYHPSVGFNTGRGEFWY